MFKLLRYVFILIFFVQPGIVMADNVNSSKALSKRYVPVMHESLAFIGLGALEIGRDWGVGAQEVRNHPSDQIAQATLSTAVNMGINVIDTANAYHLSQQRIGEYLENSGNRDKIILNSKVGNQSILASDRRCLIPSYDQVYCDEPASEYDFSAQAVKEDVANSLSQMHTSYLDTVFIHFDDNPRPVIDNGQTLKALQELKKEGKIRYIGASVDDPKIAVELINSGHYDAIELEYNLLNQSNATTIELAHQKGMEVIVRGGLATGFLTPKIGPYLNDPDLPYRDQIKALLKLCNGNYQELMALELAFLYSNPNISSVIIGAASPDELKQDIQLLDSFNNPKLLSRAEQLMKQYKPGPFTDTLDAEFQKKAEQQL